MKSTILQPVTALLACFIFATAARCASAGVIVFNNFAPDGSYANHGNWQGSFDNYEIMLAQRFQPSHGGRLEEIALGMTRSFFAGNVDELTLTIIPEENGRPGITPLWQQTYVSALTNYLGAIAEFPVAGGPILEAGTKYWVTSRSTSIGFRPHTWWESRLSNQEPRGLLNIRGGGVFPENVWTIRAPVQTSGSNSFAMRIEVVPEPATYSLAALSALLVGAAHQRPRTATASSEN